MKNAENYSLFLHLLEKSELKCGVPKVMDYLFTLGTLGTLAHFRHSDSRDTNDKGL